jgi:hypothetical protein
MRKRAFSEPGLNHGSSGGAKVVFFLEKGSFWNSGSVHLAVTHRNFPFSSFFLVFTPLQHGLDAMS